MEKYMKLAKLVETNNGKMNVNSGVAITGDVDTHRGKDMDNQNPPRENGDLSLNKMPMGEIPEHKIEGALPASGNGIPSKKVEGKLPAKKAEAENNEEEMIDMDLVKIAATLGNKEAIEYMEKVANYSMGDVESTYGNANDVARRYREQAAAQTGDVAMSGGDHTEADRYAFKAQEAAQNAQQAMGNMPGWVVPAAAGLGIGAAGAYGAHRMMQNRQQQQPKMASEKVAYEPVDTIVNTHNPDVSGPDAPSWFEKMQGKVDVFNQLHPNAAPMAAGVGLGLGAAGLGAAGYNAYQNRQQQPKMASAPNPHKEAIEGVFKLAQAGVGEAYDFLSKMEAILPGLADEIAK